MYIRRSSWKLGVVLNEIVNRRVRAGFGRRLAIGRLT